MSGMTPQKQYPTIACCGIDCGLCPRYYTAGDSRCPGCAGPDFQSKHPSCGLVTCCISKKGLEVCGLCLEFPCGRFARWDAADSFVTHARSLENLRAIRRDGISAFLEQQAERIRVLETMLADFDDGRSKSFYCLAAALLPLRDIDAAIREARASAGGSDKKDRARLIRARLEELAARTGITLKLRNKEASR